MPKLLTIDVLRKATGLDLVSSAIRSFASEGQSYESLERGTESKTHSEMRQHAIAFFERRGYAIYPSGIGIKGVFTLADFLAFRAGRIVFVECLTDAKANVQDIERKLRLSQFGEVCFVIVGGHGCAWEDDKREVPDVFLKLAKEKDVLTYYYGHWQNRFEKRISHLTEFPRVLFDVNGADGIQLAVSVKPKQKSADVLFEFKTKPYALEDEEDLVRDIARRLAWQVYDWRKFSTPARFNMSSPAGKIFKDNERKLVAQICVRGRTGLLKVRGRAGLKVLEHFLTSVQGRGLVVQVDTSALATARRGLCRLRPQNLLLAALGADRIESNLYATGQIVWVLNHFFENRPTKASELIRHLPEKLCPDLGYWLRRGVSLKQLREVGEPSRLVMDRSFVATETGIAHVREELKTLRFGEIPGKGRPYRMFSFVRHGNLLECPDEIRPELSKNARSA